MAAMFAPEQLRKSAVEAVRLSACITELAAAGSPLATRVASDCVDLGVSEFAATLSDREVDSRSPELRDLHRRLGRLIGVLNDARAKAVLAQMRSEPGKPTD
jgi:hypothetical protein